MMIHPEALQTGGVFTPKTVYDRFQVRVSGVDVNGARFKRVAPREFSVRTLVVREDPTRWLAEGKPFRFQIQNAGNPERLSLKAHTKSTLPVRLAQDFVEIGPGATKLVDVKLLVSRTSLPTQDILFLTASSTSGVELTASMEIGPPVK